jgi:transcription antitermination factor NusG
LLNRCFADTEVWYPTYTIRKYNNRKLIYETRYIPFYPNYLFIYTNLEFVFSNKITDETARVRFIKSNNAYYYLDDEEIGIIKELEKELAVSKDIIEDECIFKEDDEVRIISGPFENCNGRILKISKEKVIVHIVIFGRETKFETEVKGIVKL